MQIFDVTFLAFSSTIVQDINQLILLVDSLTDSSLILKNLNSILLYFEKKNVKLFLDDHAHKFHLFFFVRFRSPPTFSYFFSLIFFLFFLKEKKIRLSVVISSNLLI
jgi:hypothetical protein